MTGLWFEAAAHAHAHAHAKFIHQQLWREGLNDFSDTLCLGHWLETVNSPTTTGSTACHDGLQWQQLKLGFSGCLLDCFEIWPEDLSVSARNTSLGREWMFTSIRKLFSFQLQGKLGTRHVSQTLSNSLGRRCVTISLQKLFSFLFLFLFFPITRQTRH
jgi:hypothetical protein